MDEPLPDHYMALGVDKGADAATIKAVYRKLVLKCHPDKVTDPALKEQKQDEFHKIQQAYEVLGDDDKRADYEAHLTLEKLRKEKAARTPAQREKTARFDVRTAGGASFTANGPSRYSTEERKPSKHDDRYFDDRARTKYETYDAYPPKSGAVPRSSREKESSSRSTRPSTTDRTRSERDKARAKDSRTERKFVSVDSDSDDKARYEAEYKKRSADEEARRQAAEAMRKAEERRTYEDNRYVNATPAPTPAPAPSYAGSTAAAPAHRKMRAQAEEALRYQHKSRAQVEDEMARPSPVRTSSRDYYAPESRSSRREVRPEPVRRSSARPTKERPSMSSRRDTDRTLPEVVEWAEERHSDERRPPMFKTSSSSPAEFARMMPQRSYTESTPHHRHAENSPPPSFHRSATSPSMHHAPSRRKDSATARPSTLRETMTPSGSPERDAFPTVPPAQPSSSSKTTYYRYPVSGGGVPVRPEDAPILPNRHTVVREPARQHRSPSPIGKPPIGANRPTESPSTYKTTASRPNMPSRTESSRNVSPVRGSENRGRSERPRLYGEVSGESRRSGRQPSYSPSEVQYSRKYGPEDVRWAPRSGEGERERERERERYASKPTLGRTATYVY